MKMGDLRLTLSVRAYSPLCRHFFISSFVYTPQTTHVPLILLKLPNYIILTVFLFFPIDLFLLYPFSMFSLYIVPHVHLS